jgi:NAD+ diphosphatase
MNSSVSTIHRMRAIPESVSSDARWFTREEILAIFNHRSGTRFGKADYKKMAEITEGHSDAEQKSILEHSTQTLAPADATTTPQPRLAERRPSWDDLPFRLPPTSAIAGVLIRDWAEKKISFPFEDTIIRGNL